VKKITGVDVSKKSIISKLEKVTKDNFSAEILNDKVVTFLTKEAGSTMYPKLMREIKFKAGKLGVKIPDRLVFKLLSMISEKRNQSSSGFSSDKLSFLHKHPSPRL
jgi:hypothetical protein